MRKSAMVQSATAGEVSNAFGRFSRRALVEPLTITNRGDEALVLMSMQEYTRLKSRDHVTMSLDEVTQEMRDAVAASKAPEEAKAFNHELD
jgi:PHD/YefM family antitoxin component YafN of YafNO toxin-antitoxin module